MNFVLKKSSWYIVSQAVGKIIGFFYTIFLARELGVSDFGLLSTALAYFALFSAISDFGFNRYLIREVSRDHKSTPALFCNVSILRLSLSSILFGSFALLFYFIDPDRIRTYTILLAILTIIPQSISQTVDGVLMALGKFKYSALGLIFLSITYFLIGVYLVINNFGVTGVICALILGNLVYLLFLLAVMKLNKIKFLSVVETSTLKKIALGSLPYGILGILGLAYFRIDTIILSYMKGNIDTGIYSAAYKFLEAIIFIPGSFSLVLFPTLSKFISKDKIKSLYLQNLKVLGLLSLAVIVGYNLFLPVFIKTYLPAYIESIEVIRILSLSIPFIFLASPGVSLMFAQEKYLTQVIKLSILTVLLNIILNIIFIPKYSYIGAAWITVLSDILSFFIFFKLIRTKILKE